MPAIIKSLAVISNMPRSPSPLEAFSCSSSESFFLTDAKVISISKKYQQNSKVIKNTHVLQGARTGKAGYCPAPILALDAPILSNHPHDLLEALRS